MAKQFKFWMVLGDALPVVRHDSKASAQREAVRLARQLPGRQFFVLEAVSLIEKSDVTVTTLEQEF
jgi:hypothetical protein